MVTDDGGLFSWGRGEDGRLGHGGYENELAPRLLERFAGRRAKFIAAGHAHSVVVMEGGGGAPGAKGVDVEEGESEAAENRDEVYCWGRGAHGRLGK